MAKDNIELDLCHFKKLESNCPNNSKFNTIVFTLSVKCFHTENPIIYLNTCLIKETTWI